MRILESIPDSVGSLIDPAYAMFLAEKKVPTLPYFVIVNLQTPANSYP
jgi:hypothetical protein